MLCRSESEAPKTRTGWGGLVAVTVAVTVAVPVAGAVAVSVAVAVKAGGAEAARLSSSIRAVTTTASLCTDA